MYLPKELASIEDTRLVGYWHDGKVPVYEVTTVHGLNQMVGYVKHTNANDGTVLYRGQARLYEKLIPSILHENPTEAELKTRSQKLSNYVEKIAADDRMGKLLHFDESTDSRYFYKLYVIESMLQHYGLRTRFQDFVDNHWTALWFGLYELKQEAMDGCSPDSKCFQYYYSRRNSVLNAKEKAPDCLVLKEPEYAPIPPEPDLYQIFSPTDYTEELLVDQKSARELKYITDEEKRKKAFQTLVRRDIGAKEEKNRQRIESWEKFCFGKSVEFRALFHPVPEHLGATFSCDPYGLHQLPEPYLLMVSSGQHFRHFHAFELSGTGILIRLKKT